MALIDRKLEDWKRKLLDLTRRNPALFFKPQKPFNLRVQSPDAQRLLQRLLVDEKGRYVFIPPPLPDTEALDEEEDFEDDASTLFASPGPEDIVFVGKDGKALRRRIKSLHRAAHEDFEERALQTLHLAFGLLNWSEGGNEICTSPLLLVPVTLERDAEKDRYTLGPADEDPVLNPSLVAKLAESFRLNLPDIPEDFEQSDYATWLQAVAEAVCPYKWSVEDSSWLARFSFHKLSLYQDLKANGDKFKESSLIRALAGEPHEGAHSSTELPREENLDEQVKPHDSYVVLDADSSQLVCIEAIDRGHNLVIQGPPGTGKSQTIVNLIAQLLGRGKSVLFVSEKIAALEVVFNRLKAVNIGDLCLELHSHKANKREVVSELYRTLRARPALSGQPSEQDLDRLEKRRSEVNVYAAAIFEKYGCMQRNMFYILGELAKVHGVPHLSCKYDYASLNDLGVENATDLARDLARVWDVAVLHFSHPWYGCTTAGSLLSQKSALLHEVEQLSAATEALAAELSRVTLHLGTKETTSVEEAMAIHDVASVVDLSPGIEPRWLSYDGEALSDEIAAWNRAFEQRDQIHDWLTQQGVQHAVNVEYFSKDSWTRERAALTEISSDANTQERIVQSLPNVLAWLGSAQPCTAELRRTIDQLQSALDTSSEDSVQAAITLLRAANAADSTACPDRAWFDRPTYAALREGLAALEQDLRASEAAKAKLLERYDDAILLLDLDALIRKFSNDYKSIFRFVKRGYREAIAELRACRRDGVLPKDVLSDLREARDCVRRESDLKSNNARAIALLGDRYRGATTDFATISDALDTVREVNAIISEPSERMLRIACGIEPAMPLRAVCAKLEALLSTFQALKNQRNAINDGEHIVGMDQAVLHADLRMLEAHLGMCAGVAGRLCKYLQDAIGEVKSDISTEWVSNVARKVDDYRAARTECTRILGEVQARFGTHYLYDAVPNWTKLFEIASWLRNREKISAYANPTLLNRLRDPASQVHSRLNICVDAFRAAIGLLRVSFLDPQAESKKEIESQDTAVVSAVCARLIQNIDRLQEWRDFVTIQSRFADAGLAELFEKMEQMCSSLSAGELTGVVRKSLLQGYVDHQFTVNSTLAQFRGSAHNDIIRDFAETDKRTIRGNHARVVRTALEGRPEQFVAYQGSETQVLLREANRKRRHLPIRKLFANMPRLLQQLKPCLLMSPLSVSQFLDPQTIQFDCVIFDEASQICSEDAVSAIYRAKQLVVCGDKQQLPPTNFFKQAAADDSDEQDDDEAVAVFDSILAEADTAGFPSKQLKWHYRSAHESLIAFSNEQFYNHSLVTFPSATIDPEKTVVRLCYVPDGVYDRGGRRDNSKEADRVVQLVLEHIAQHQDESLGVVAFSKQQADAIQNRIDLLRKQRRDLEWFFSDDRVNGFFVKNLERVQGDERDRIIFSIGYGRDKNGRLTMEFGPINKDGGEKRLNVAVTRARLGVTVVSSIRASDMDLTRVETSGVLALHKYLDYAERGYAALDVNLIRADYESPFEEDVAGEIRAMGYHVFPQVGVSGFRIDLGVCDPAQPGRFILGVECDGATYHSAYTARDRDRLRQEILETKMHWKLHRIWSPDWIQQRSLEIERLRRAIEEARLAIPVTAAATTVEAAINTEPVLLQPEADVLADAAISQFDEIDKVPEREWIRPYKIASIASRPLSCEFHDPTATERLSLMALEVIGAEAPVHKSVVAARVAKRWGLSKVGSRMVDSMERAYRLLARRGDILIQEESFLSPNHDFRCTFVRCPVPGNPDTLRPIDHVSAEELAVAVRALLWEASSFEADQLVVQVARSLGYDRTGSAIRDRIARVVNRLREAGEIQEMGGRLISK